MRYCLWNSELAANSFHGQSTMYPWELRDLIYRRVQELLPGRSDYVYKTLGVFLCYKNCLANQLYVFGTSAETDKPWVHGRAFRYMKKVMLDWCDMKGIKNDIFPRRNEMLTELFAIHQPLLEHHYYLYQIDFACLAATLARRAGGSPVNHLIAARSLCNVLYNLEEYRYVWGTDDVRLHLQGRLNFYNGHEVWLDFEGLQRDGEFWACLYSTMGYYREKYGYTKSLFAFS